MTLGRTLGRTDGQSDMSEYRAAPSQLKNALSKWQYTISFSKQSRNLLMDTDDVESDLK